MNHLKSDYSGIKSKRECHIIRPHVEIFFAKILKIGQVIAIFVRLTKIQKQVKKNSRKGFFGHF